MSNTTNGISNSSTIQRRSSAQNANMMEELRKQREALALRQAALLQVLKQMQKKIASRDFGQTQQEQQRFAAQLGQLSQDLRGLGNDTALLKAHLMEQTKASQHDPELVNLLVAENTLLAQMDREFFLLCKDIAEQEKTRDKNGGLELKFYCHSISQEHAEAKGHTQVYSLELANSSTGTRMDGSEIPQPAASSIAHADEPSANRDAAEFAHYTVKPGDSLWAIAKQHGLDPQVVINLNRANFADINLIHPGDTVVLPMASSGQSQNVQAQEELTEQPFHTVQSGDTLSEIAARNHVSLDEVVALNPHIRDVNLIFPGQRVYLAPERLAGERMTRTMSAIDAASQLDRQPDRLSTTRAALSTEGVSSARVQRASSTTLRAASSGSIYQSLEIAQGASIQGKLGVHWFSDTWGSANKGSAIQSMKEMGVGYAVLLIDPVRPSVHDSVIRELQQHGITPVVRLYEATPPDQWDAGMINRMAQAAKELQDQGVRLIQIGNEPNHRDESKLFERRHVSPQEYIQKTIENTAKALKAVKQAAPEVRFGAPPMAPGTPNAPDQGYFLSRDVDGQTGFYTKMMQGLAQKENEYGQVLVDWVATHPYAIQGYESGAKDGDWYADRASQILGREVRGLATEGGPHPNQWGMGREHLQNQVQQDVDWMTTHAISTTCLWPLYGDNWQSSVFTNGHSDYEQGVVAPLKNLFQRA